MAFNHLSLSAVYVNIFFMKEKKSRLLSGSPISFHPWIYFSIFLISNILLSYFHIPLSAKLWIGTMGVLLPFALLLWSAMNKRLQKPLTQDFTWLTFTQKLSDPPLNPKLWGFFILFVIITRFYRLTALPFWPLSDEGIFATLALDFSKSWHGDLLWAEGRIEPLLIWTMGAFFRITEPSLQSLRLYPTLLSLGSIPLAYWAARQFFTRFFSFMFTWFFAFSFWEFSLMRFCTPEDLIPFFQLLALGLLGGFFQSKTRNVQWWWIGALCICNVFGFYSYINWVVVWFFIILVLGVHAFSRKVGGKNIFFSFLFGGLLPVVPLALARLAPGGMAYARSVWGELFSLQSLLSYFTGLFWNSETSFPFAPNWGGMFDPVTGSLILMGIVYALEKMSWVWLGVGFAGLLSSLSPGIVTNYLELQRVTPSLPFWMVLAALGIQFLFSRPLWRSPWTWLLPVCLVPLGLNFYDFGVPYNDIKNVPSIHQWRNVQYADAYQTLLVTNNKTEPLYVFSEFNTDYDNKTLNIAVYPFDVLQNPSISAASPKWAALIINIQYAPFLLQRFPGLKFKVLGTDKNGPDDLPPFGMFLIPVSQIPPSTLSNWKEADRYYRKINLQVKNKNPIQTWNIFAEKFSLLKTRFQEDRLLTAVYWEKIGFFKFLSGHFFEAAESYQKALSQGVPAAHLFYDLGICFKIMNRTEEANRNFEKAQLLSMKTF